VSKYFVAPPRTDDSSDLIYRALSSFGENIGRGLEARRERKLRLAQQNEGSEVERLKLRQQGFIDGRPSTIQHEPVGMPRMPDMMFRPGDSSPRDTAFRPGDSSPSPLSIAGQQPVVRDPFEVDQSPIRAAFSGFTEQEPFEPEPYPVDYSKSTENYSYVPALDEAYQNRLKSDEAAAARVEASKKEELSKERARLQEQLSAGGRLPKDFDMNTDDVDSLRMAVAALTGENKREAEKRAEAAARRSQETSDRLAVDAEQRRQREADEREREGRTSRLADAYKPLRDRPQDIHKRLTARDRALGITAGEVVNRIDNNYGGRAGNQPTDPQAKAYNHVLEVAKQNKIGSTSAVSWSKVKKQLDEQLKNKVIDADIHSRAKALVDEKIKQAAASSKKR
jgi:hypothetical protein